LIYRLNLIHKKVGLVLSVGTFGITKICYLFKLNSCYSVIIIDNMGKKKKKIILFLLFLLESGTLWNIILNSWF